MLQRHPMSVMASPWFTACANDVLSLLEVRKSLALAKATVVSRIEEIALSQMSATHEAAPTFTP